MSRWVEDAEIAGVSFEGCQVLLLDGAEFATEVRGSVNVAASGLPRLVAVRLTNGRGRFFGFSLPYAPADKLALANDAITEAQATLTPFLVRGTTALYTVNHYCHLDPGQKEFDTGKESEGIIEQVVYRFVTVGAAP
jgi:hypothetical protein